MRLASLFAAAALAFSLAPGAAQSQSQSPEPAPRFTDGSGPGDRMPSGRALGTRSAVVAPNAAAATAHPLATQVALDVMKAGGNAVDAAIAANAMLGLVEPTGNGIGGDLFAIVYDPDTGELYGYNGSGRAPMGATLADMQAAADAHGGGTEIPPFGAAPVSVPGTVDGWFALHERFGSEPMAELLAPTVRYAREGAPIPEVIAYYWGRNETRLREAANEGMLEDFAPARDTFFSPSPAEGALFTNPDLASTLARIGQEGRGAFYEGDTARAIDAHMKEIGGFLRYEDMAAHGGEWTEVHCTDYRDTVRLCELGPNTQGVAALQMLQMLERFDLAEMGWGSADAIMAQVEAKRLAFADRAIGYADPAFDGDMMGVLLDRRYNEAAGAQISLDAPLPSESVEDGVARFNAYTDGDPRPPLSPDFDMDAADRKLEDGDTTYLTVTDEAGMMVSLIQSNYRGMGSGVVAPGTGFMLQDRGQLFSLDPDHPNVFEPGKRPFHTIIPAFAWKRDLPGCQVASTSFEAACPMRPWMSFGLMGGGMQPQGHVQIIVNMIDFGMGLQEAGDAARWEHRGGCEPTDGLGSDCSQEIGTIHLESGIPQETREALEARGYAVECCRANGGGYQAVARDFEHGTWLAATEMRKDGAADGF